MGSLAGSFKNMTTILASVVSDASKLLLHFYGTLIIHFRIVFRRLTDQNQRIHSLPNQRPVLVKQHFPCPLHVRIGELDQEHDHDPGLCGFRRIQAFEGDG